MQDRAAAIGRIRKLLRVAQCPAARPAEVAAALGRAEAIMREHGLDADALGLDRETCQYLRQRVRVGARLPFIRVLASGLVASVWHVEAIWCPPHIVFFGREADAVFADYAFGFLCATASRAVSRYAQGELAAQRRMSPRKRRGFIAGWFGGVASNLREARPVEDAGARLARREAFEETYAQRTTKKVDAKARINDSAVTAGWVEGKATQILTPLNTAAPAGQLLLC